MRKKQLKELHFKSIKELDELAKKTQAELVRLQTDLKTGKLKNIYELKKKKRDLAVLKTILREKDLLGQKEKTASV